MAINFDNYTKRPILNFVTPETSDIIVRKIQAINEFDKDKNISVSDSLWEQRDTLSQLIGQAPNTHKVLGSDHRMNAIWQVDIEGYEVNIFLSKAGLSIEVEESLSYNEVEIILDGIISMLEVDLKELGKKYNLFKGIT